MSYEGFADVAPMAAVEATFLIVRALTVAGAGVGRYDGSVSWALYRATYAASCVGVRSGIVSSAAVRCPLGSATPTHATGVTVHDGYDSQQHHEPGHHSVHLQLYQKTVKSSF